SNERVRHRQQIDQRDMTLGRNLANYSGVLAVGVLKRTARVEFPAHDRREEDRNGLLCPRLGDESLEVLTVRCMWRGVASRVFGFFVVVAELYEDVVARDELTHHCGPPSFVDKALRAPSV